MSDEIKFEFIQILDELAEQQNKLTLLNLETEKLKEQYNLDPNNQELLDYIKAHEEKYKELYEKSVALNKRSKELLKKSNEEENSEN